MKERSAAIMKNISSETCNKILQCLKEGLDHPDDICAKLGVVRQTVDWHLLRLSALGIVERIPISSLSGRPKIVYKLSPDGEKLINIIDDAVYSHYSKVKKEYDKAIDELDRKLATAKISEDVYKENIRRLEKDLKILEGAGTA
ncbi:MAG: hypothetical protein KAS67_06705 [Thermoplasmata archaeon]|nr:hypothetical protein [Thermoplasmata archaeon]